MITIPRKYDIAQKVIDQPLLKTDQAQEVTDQVIGQARSEIDQPLTKTDQATDQPQPNTDQLRISLSKKQIDIRNFCSVPRTAKEIIERAGVTSHFYNRKKYIYDLVEAGVLEPTIPDKPNDPNQKYRRKK